jgi:hypothetical protein
MAGLSLSTGLSGHAQGNIGSYTPMTPAAAQSTAGQRIAQKAYGITGTGVSTGASVAGYGSVGVGVAALAALVYLWWSLPR